MKTHSIAKALRKLADILESEPNTDLDNYVFIRQNGKPNKKGDEIIINLKTLAGLSKISKKEWVSLIKDYNFPIAINTRDSSRNIIGKLLNYLDKNPDAVNVLKTRTKDTGAKSSSLLQALDILLEDV